jgi:predicted DNA-binding transcriptional regulator YafY
MLDHAFRRRREIERMLLSGKKLTVAELMGRYCVGRKSISRDFWIYVNTLDKKS